MNKKLVNVILSKFDVSTIESHLFQIFIEDNQLNHEQSEILTNYLQHFERNPELSFLIKELEINSVSELENHLELLIPKSDRKINGAFFTPTFIVDFIISEISPARDDLNLDPSCGCGAFLLGLIRYYRNNFGSTVEHIVKNNIYGVDILEYNVRRTKLLITIYALQHGEYLIDTDFNLFICDSLRHDWTIQFDNVLGNPPYVKFQDLSDDNRKHLNGQSWESVSNGNFNLYFPFFELGFNLLKTAGKLGYITPNNYFTSLAGKSLRKYFHQKKCVFRVIDFRDKKIFDAQTYTALTFISKVENDKILYDRIKKDQTPDLFLKNANGSPNSLSDLNTTKWRLLKKEEQQNIKNIENAGVPLGELFEIKVGIATLKDALYFISDPKIIDDKYYRKEIPSGSFLIEREVTRRIYKISELKNYVNPDDYFKRAITPYKFNKGSYLPIGIEEMRSQFPECYKYLKAIKEELQKRDKGKIDVNPYYLWGRSQAILSHGLKILTPTFSSKPNFILANNDDSYFSNGYAIFISEYDSNLHIQKKSNVDVLMKILNSKLMEYFIDKTSVSIEGDYPCYQKNFIERFNIPNLEQPEIELLRSLNHKEEIDHYLMSRYQVNIPVPNLLS